MMHSLLSGNKYEKIDRGSLNNLNYVRIPIIDIDIIIVIIVMMMIYIALGLCPLNCINSFW